MKTPLSLSMNNPAGLPASPTLTGLVLNGTTAASSSLTGTLIIGDGSAATSVGIGGGVIFAGGGITLGSTALFTGAGALMQSTGATTSNKYTDIRNTGGGYYLGIESAAGGTIFLGDTAYATVFGSQGATPLQLATNGVVRQTIASAGGTTFTAAVSVSNTVATITSGNGTPESAVTAPIGSIFLRIDGGASTTLYVKQSGAGNTGWVAK